MNLPIVLRDVAQAEFDEAFDSYDAQRPGLGVAFAERVQADLSQMNAPCGLGYDATG